MQFFSDIDEEYIEKVYKNIVRNIEKIRIKKGLTQLELSLSLGFSSATFYTNAKNLKNNKRFNIFHLIKLAKILEVDICEFFIPSKKEKIYQI